MDSSNLRSTRFGVFPEIWRRITVWWPLKMIGTTIGMSVFFVVYFWVLKHPPSLPRPMPLTTVDRWIGFWPGALPIYFSLWFYVSLAPALLTTFREFVLYAVSAVAVGVIGLGIFHFWPTAVPQVEMEWTQYPGFSFLKSIDATGNACPSLHVAFAVFSAAWFGYSLRQMGAGRLAQAANWLWCLAIIYSTIATRQHVALDVVAGTSLGGCIAVLILRVTPRSSASG